jgi:shikimate kinase
MFEKKIISLVGMMGCGKTTIGALCAEKLGWNFIDSDIEIEKIHQASIKDIFKNCGEEYFREQEYKAISDISFGQTKKNILIATGGGAYIWSPTNRLLKQKSFVIWLDVDPEIIYERIKYDNSRPLISDNEYPQQKIKDMYHKRVPIYSDCDLRIDANSVDINATINLILSKLTIS